MRARRGTRRSADTRASLTENGYIWTVMQDPEGNEFCVGKSPAQAST